MKRNRRSLGCGRKREATERALDVDERARLEVRWGPGVPVRVDADEQLEAVRRARASSGAAAIEYGPRSVLPVARRSSTAWPGAVGERRAAQVEAHDPRARRGGQDVADRQRQQHGALC